MHGPAHFFPLQDLSVDLPQRPDELQRISDLLIAGVNDNLKIIRPGVPLRLTPLELPEVLDRLAFYASLVMLRFNFWNSFFMEHLHMLLHRN